jgi:hypothetical protein
MSLLRLLSPSRQLALSSSTTLTPSLSLWVPNYGTIYLESSPTDNSNSNSIHEVQPQNDYMLSGHLDIKLPDHVSRARVRAVRVVFVTIMMNDKTPSGVKEQDVVFERKVEMIAGNAEGLFLEKHSSR